jgi:DNA repair protein RadC
MQNLSSTTLVSEIKISYKTKVKPSDRIKITSSRDAFQTLKALWDEEQIELAEEFKIILLNRANKVLGVVPISKGSSTGTVADPKMIFAAALKANACGIILAHNHPSGNLRPSEADLNLTKKLKEGGKILEIAVLDHLIITVESFMSFADEGLL